MTFRSIAVLAFALSSEAAVTGGTTGRLLDVPFVSQSENLCGGAAVAMVLRYWGERGVFAEDFSAYLDEERSGISTASLVEAARARGARAFPFRGDAPSVRRHLDEGRPVVVLLDAGPDRYHYVVLVGWSEDGEVVLHDPVRGAFRRFEERTFRELWSGSGRWALLLVPGEKTEADTIALGNVREDESCGPLVEEAVALSDTGDIQAAEGLLETAIESCPGDPDILRELAGLRLLQTRNEEAIALAERAVAIDPEDAHGWRTLATARFLGDDDEGALRAWNQVGEPTVDLTSVSGTERTPPRLVIERLGLSPKQVLKPESLSRARRRMSELPALSFSALRYRPVAGGLAEIEASAVERPIFVGGVFDLASRSLRAITDREVSLDLTNAARRGERWEASWRFWEERPRIAATLELPGLFGLPGIGRVHAEWDRQSYQTTPNAITRETRRSVRFAISDWATARNRWEVSVGGDAWEDRGGYFSLGGALDRRWLEDRLSTRVSAEGFVGARDSFATGTLEAYWRSSAHPVEPLRLLGRVRFDTTSSGAPLALWQGAGLGHARSSRLRAHPLLDHGVIAGDVFGRHVLSGGIELERFQSKPALLRIGFAAFVDAAKSWQTLSDGSTAHVDAGVGLRLSLGAHGTFRIDLARGLQDGSTAASLGYALGWLP